MPDKVVESYADIQRHFIRIRKIEEIMRTRQCALRQVGFNLAVSDCWCYHAGENGSNLPCPTLQDGSQLSSIDANRAIGGEKPLPPPPPPDPTGGFSQDHYDGGC